MWMKPCHEKVLNYLIFVVCFWISLCLFWSSWIKLVTYKPSRFSISDCAISPRRNLSKRTEHSVPLRFRLSPPTSTHWVSEDGLYPTQDSFRKSQIGVEYMKYQSFMAANIDKTVSSAIDKKCRRKRLKKHR